MDTLETLLNASDSTLEPLEDEHGDEDASIEDVAERIDRSIYAALVAS